MENELLELEKEIESIVNENTEIILRIEKKKSNNAELKKFFYEVERPKLNYQFNKKEPLTLSVKEQTGLIKIREIVNDWIIPSNREKPKEVDPDKLLYGSYHDLMDGKCENFEDLVRWNKQKIVCKKYLTVLRESMSMKFGLVFKKNFEIIQNLLSLLESEIKEDDISEIEDIEVKLKDINRQISNFFDIKGVCNRYFNSKILTEDMKKSLEKMFNKNLKFVLIHDETKGYSVDDFDKAVNGIGPTLIIIKSTTGYVFGAYVHDTFGVPGGWIKGSEETFIFTLMNNNTPVKLLHNGGQNGIYISSCGLHLSTDFVAFCCFSCDPSVYTKIAQGYNSNLVVNDTLLAGASSYQLQEMEIFSVSEL